MSTRDNVVEFGPQFMERQAEQAADTGHHEQAALKFEQAAEFAEQHGRLNRADQLREMARIHWGQFVQANRGG